MKRRFVWLWAMMAAMTAYAQQPAPFVPVEVPQTVKARMAAHRPQGAVAWEALRYIPMLHYTAEGRVATGEMVVHRDIAADVADIFRELYRLHYPIERMQLADAYDCDDERCMQANNTSAYCHRAVKGSTRLSKHAEGRAVDLNPLYNPCFRIRRNAKGDSIGYQQLQPATAGAYVRRDAPFPYKLTPADPAVKLFKKKGFRWGGDWWKKKDYQHFER
jgi:hypothetical protein